MTEKTNVPEIRFAGFTDPWEQCKLGDCFEFLKNNTLSRADLNGENGTARNVHYGDILIKFGDCLNGERSDLPFINDDTVLPKFAGSILREGDVIFADTAEDEAAGKCVELRKLSKEPTISGLHTIPARPRFPFGTGYLGHYLNSDAYHGQLLPLMQGIKVISVSKAALQDTQVRFPGLSEQTAIGAALSEIDTLIALHQRKHDKLVQLKKSMLDKMFPKPGEAEPEIRFAGFTDPWEQRKLGELLLFQNGFNGSSESFGSGIPLISVMDVLDDEFITHETIRGKARLNYEEASRYCVEYGDVLFQRSSENQEDAGTSNVYLDQHVPSAFGGFVIRGKKVDEYNPIFIKYLLGSSFIRKQIIHRAQGAQHINVSQDTLADVVLLMPSMREQEAVGLVFLHLANLITLHQRKLELLRNTKKSLLERMFV